MLIGVVIIPLWMKNSKAEADEKLCQRKQSEFKEYMMLVSNALQAGYSLERAFKQSESEMIKLFAEGSVVLRYVHELNQKIAVNIQAERAFCEFASAIDLEEATSLSQILVFAKRSGGDYGKHIRNAAMKIEEKLLVQQEIDILTTEKKLELKVMSVMPLFILGYISITSKEFIAPLYNNLAGVIVMTVCLLVYGLMIYLGKRVIKIDV